MPRITRTRTNIHWSTYRQYDNNIIISALQNFLSSLEEREFDSVIRDEHTICLVPHYHRNGCSYRANFYEFACETPRDVALANQDNIDSLERIGVEAGMIRMETGYTIRNGVSQRCVFTNIQLPVVIGEDARNLIGMERQMAFTTEGGMNAIRDMFYEFETHSSRFTTLSSIRRKFAETIIACGEVPYPYKKDMNAPRVRAPRTSTSTRTTRVIAEGETTQSEFNLYSMDRVMGYHNHHGLPLITHYMGNGEITIGFEHELCLNSCEFDTSASDLIRCYNNNGMWGHIYAERDGSITNGTYDVGCEIISVPHSLKNFNELPLEPIWEKLRELGARPYDSKLCGLHFHINKSLFGRSEQEIIETTTKLYYYLINNNNSLNKICGRPATSYCRRPQYNNIYDIESWVRNSRYDRYCLINLNNSATVEFRGLRGTTNAERFRALVHLVICLTKNVKQMDINDMPDTNRHDLYLKDTTNEHKVWFENFCSQKEIFGFYSSSTEEEE